MAFLSRTRAERHATTPVPEETSAWKADALPTLMHQADLALLAILVMIVVPELRGMQFARGAAFFYWAVAFVTFQVPCMAVFGWLARQAPARVPLYLWIVRLLDERWRSVLLFLSWWSGVLIILPAIGICLDLLQAFFPSTFGSVLVQCLTFVLLLALATFFACLPVRLFRIVLWIGGLCYLAVFALLGIAMLVFLLRIQRAGEALPHLALTILPQPFSWSLFGLALLSQLGVNAPLFLDGELRGPQRFLRRSTSYLWWAGCGALVVLALSTAFWVTVNPNMQVMQQRLLFLARPILGQEVVLIAWGLLFVGTFGCALAFLFVFSRAFLLAARQRALPHALARLSRAGTPVRAILAQSTMILGTAVLLLLVAPALLRAFVPNSVLSELSTGDHFGLLAAIAGSLWSLLTALLFVFALWLLWKKHGAIRGHWRSRLVLPGMCVSGCVTALVCAFAPLLRDWPVLFFSQTHWFPAILVGFACSLALAWVIGELPRRNALVRAKAQSLAREKALREGLQRSYTRELDLHHQLQDTYDEQQILMLRQKVLLDEVNRLYQEQKQMAMTDQVTGLFNHRTFLERLEETITRCQQNGGSFLLVFLDLDHFKAINDTWGHLAGDAVLREVAARLQEALQPGDVASRYGGEEFTLIIDGAASERARDEGEHLRRLMHAAPCRWKPTAETRIEIGITVSIGVAAYGLHGTQSKELLEQADQAMYQAKLAGRNCVRVASTRTPPDQPSVNPPPSLLPMSWEQGEEQEENTTQVSGQAIRILAAVLQAHDALSGAHAARVSWLAEETGRRLGASPEELFLMRLGGLCHDLGKLGLPEAILQKVGPLNEQEWEVMQRHAVIGARILENAGGMFRQVALVVQAHHERWDGQGYPQGLKSEAIPRAARVISVVDAYDTMVSRRSYKEPLSISAAEAELRRNAGTQFDPAVVPVFLSVLKTAGPNWHSLQAGLP